MLKTSSTYNLSYGLKIAWMDPSRRGCIIEARAKLWDFRRTSHMQF